MPDVISQFLDEKDDIVTEGAKTTRVVRTKLVKIRAQAGLEALRIAKERGDPMHAKYKKLRAKALKLKKKLMLKYGKKGLKSARQKML